MADQKKNTGAVADKQAEIWFEKNWKKILLSIVVLLVVGMGIFYGINQRAVQQKTAAAELAAAEVSDIAGLLEKNPDVPGAAAARLRLIKSLCEEKKYTEAAKQLSLLAADENASPVIRSRARLDAASCKELNGELKEAAEMYLELSNDYSIASELRNEAAYQAGRLLLALKDARGKDVLKTLAEVPADPLTGKNFWQKNASALLAE
jgi:hypothetical protein